MYHAILTDTMAAAAAMPANRFVTPGGAVPAANANCIGVTRAPAGAAGDLVPVDMLGITEVEASAAIAAGALIATTADGRAVTHSTGAALARARTAAGAAGQLLEVLLIPN